MTNKEYREKHPIGTRIKYKGSGFSRGLAAKDAGKTGKIVGYDLDKDPIIFLPKSKHVSWCSTPLCPASWQTCWSHVEILSQKNQQLMFAFME